jgi:hypothetical protein
MYAKRSAAAGLLGGNLAKSLQLDLRDPPFGLPAIV